MSEYIPREGRMSAQIEMSAIKVTPPLKDVSYCCVTEQLIHEFDIGGLFSRKVSLCSPSILV